MMAVKHYRELIVWQKAMDFVIKVYKETAGFPKDESFGLTAQLRRAGVSIPSNIAEGQGRESVREFRHFLAIARGSLQEAQTQILLSERLTYIAPEKAQAIMELAMEVGRLINGLSNSLLDKS